MNHLTRYSPRNIVTAVICAAGVLLSLPATGRADVLTFGTGNLDRLDLAGPQVEGNFTYTATVGDGWEIQDVFGNPPSALVTFFNGEAADVNDVVNITRVGGGVFSFASVDTMTVQGSGNPGNTVTITGFLGDTSVGSLLLNTSSGMFQTVTSPFAGSIDRLEVRVTDTFNNNSNARVLDNFNLNIAGVAVPEAGTLALFLPVLGMAGAVVITKRRKK